MFELQITSCDGMAGQGDEELPVDWTRHQSKSNPGHVYYFNSRTGAKTWDRQQVFSYEENVRNKKEKKTADFTISQLEQMLEQKREEERKRKLPREELETRSEEEISATKRQKVTPKPSTNTTPNVEKSQKSRSSRKSESGVKKTDPHSSPVKYSSSKNKNSHGSVSYNDNQREKFSSEEKVSTKEPEMTGSSTKKLHGYKIPLNSPSSTKKDCPPQGDEARVEYQRVSSNNPMRLCFKKVRTPSPPAQSSSQEDRPHTPLSVRELQEEEEMEWETADLQVIIKETLMARERVCQAMEVEEDRSEDHSPLAAPGSGMVAVIDTNVFISSLPVVTSLLETDHVTVLVPWMVVQELDSLKVSERSDTAVRARAAVRRLNCLLQARPGNLVTQTASQSRAVAAKFQSKSPDDRILATCMDAMENGMKIFLVSNDVNLCNKALINGVKCGKSDNVVNVLSSQREEMSSNEVSLATDTEDLPSKNTLNDLMKKAREVTRDLLEGVLIKEFQEAFGEKLWRKMTSIQPQARSPHWALRDLFTLYSKHHIAVFGLSFPKNGHELKNRLQIAKEKLSVADCRRIQEPEIAVTEVLRLVDTIGNKDDYDGLVSSVRDRMTELSREIEQLKLKASSKRKIIDIPSEDSSQGKIESHLTSLWQFILAYTRAFAEACHVPHDLPQVEPSVQLQSHSMQQLRNFFEAVDGVYKSMENIVKGKPLNVIPLIRLC